MKTSARHAEVCVWRTNTLFFLCVINGASASRTLQILGSPCFYISSDTANQWVNDFIRVHVCSARLKVVTLLRLNPDVNEQKDPCAELQLRLSLNFCAEPHKPPNMDSDACSRVRLICQSHDQFARPGQEKITPEKVYCGEYFCEKAANNW